MKNDLHSEQIKQRLTTKIRWHQGQYKEIELSWEWMEFSNTLVSDGMGWPKEAQCEKKPFADLWASYHWNMINTNVLGLGITKRRHLMMPN